MNDEQFTQYLIDKIEDEGYVSMAGEMSKYTGGSNSARDLLKFTAKLVETGKYVKEYLNSGQTRVYKNPNYDLSQSVVETNAAVRQNFVSQNRVSNITLWIAGVSTLFIILSTIVQVSDNTARELKEIKAAMIHQEQSMRTLSLSLQEIKDVLKNREALTIKIDSSKVTR